MDIVLDDSGHHLLVAEISFGEITMRQAVDAVIFASIFKLDQIIVFVHDGSN